MLRECALCGNLDIPDDPWLPILNDEITLHDSCARHVRYLISDGIQQAKYRAIGRALGDPERAT